MLELLNRFVNFIKALFSKTTPEPSVSETSYKESERILNEVDKVVERYPISSNPNDPAKKTARKAAKQL